VPGISRQDAERIRNFFDQENSGRADPFVPETKS